MNKRTVITLDGNPYLIPEGKDLGVLIETITQWQKVEKDPYRRGKYRVDGEPLPEVTVAIVSEESISDGKPKPAPELSEIPL